MKMIKILKEEMKNPLKMEKRQIKHWNKSINFLKKPRKTKEKNSSVKENAKYNKFNTKYPENLGYHEKTKPENNKDRRVDEDGVGESTGKARTGRRSNWDWHAK